MKQLLVLGSTGSIGTQTLSVVGALPGEFGVWGLSAHNNVELLLKQARQYRPKAVALTDSAAAERARGQLPEGTALFAGPEGLLRLCDEAAGQAHMALVAIVGIAGLPAVVRCIQGGMDIALANKEALVTGGALVNDLLNKNRQSLYPVDSEHSAIFQCLQGLASPQELRRVILTCSGGPFFGYTPEQLAHVTAAQALKHPNWAMGAKITIDSATLMNKGLEVIEARWLFDRGPQDIDVVIHRQSIVHSMVELMDHSVLAQMGCPDMRIPIQYALTWPRRLDCEAPALDILKVGTLTFLPPDREAFPCLRLAYEALRRGGGAAIALNAANEVAVARFLAGGIGFSDIPRVIEGAMDAAAPLDPFSLEDILAQDAETRARLASANEKGKVSS